MQSEDYRIVRFTLLRNDLKPVPIYTEDADGSIKPIEPFHLTIVHTPETNNNQDGYILYFLDESGAMLEILPYETLEIAMDQAHAIAGVRQNEWLPCNVAVPPDDIMPWRLFVSA